MKTIGNKNVSYTTYDINNPIDMAYSMFECWCEDVKLRDISNVLDFMHKYSTPFGKEMYKYIRLFAGSRDIDDNKTYNDFDKWCEIHNIKVYGRCKKCNKLIYVFERDLKEIPEYCFKCEQDNKVMLK